MKKLYLDFDGVIMNTNLIFDEMIEKLNIDVHDKEALRAFFTRVDFEAVLSRATPINNSLEQIGELIKSNKFRIKVLTHVNSLHEAEVKIAFMKKIYPLIEVVVVPKTFDKNLMANPKDSILVDDYAPNLVAWEAAGGIGVRFSPKGNGKGFKTVAELKQLLTLFDEE